MSLSRLAVGNHLDGFGPRFGARISWKAAALFGVPLGIVGLVALLHYVRKRRSEKRGTDLTPETPLESALALKIKGNKYFKGGQYAQAISLYDEGLEKCPIDAIQERAAFYQNRAAAKENLRQYESAIEDCSAALSLSPNYLKALNRRAHLYEKLEKWDECLMDVTACSIFEKFSNHNNILYMDQMLKKIGQLKAQQEHKKLLHELPSVSFIRNYLSAFAWDPFTKDAEIIRHNNVSESTNGVNDDMNKSNANGTTTTTTAINNNTMLENNNENQLDTDQLDEPIRSAYLELEQAIDCLVRNDYDQSLDHAKKSITLFEKVLSTKSLTDIPKAAVGDEASNNTESVQEPVTSDKLSETKEKTSHSNLNNETLRKQIRIAYNKAALLYATYQALSGRSEEAKERFQAIGASDSGASVVVRVNALIKSACLSMSAELDLAACLFDFQRAQGACPECPDVYLHRGQINLLADQLDEAFLDLNTAVKLKPEFSVAQAQRLYTLYRCALSSSDTSKVNARVEEFRRLVKKYPNCLETHSLFAQILTERGEFEESDKEFADLIALAPDSGMTYAHRGLLHLRWKHDREAAYNFFMAGMKADPKCELIHELLGQLAVEKGQFREALEHFDLAIRQAKTQTDLAHLFSLREGVNAQLKVCEKYNIAIPEVVSNIQREQQQFMMAMQP